MTLALALGLGLGLAQRRAGVSNAAILALFANGEQGAWYDPSDRSTLFEDAAGTIPVAGDGRPVGLILDKRLWGGKTLAQVLAGQPELISNGGLTVNANGWTAVNSPIVTHGVNGASIQNNGATYGFLYQAIPAVVGRLYQISVDIDFTGPGFARVDWAGSLPATIGGNPVNVNSDGHYSGVFVATATTIYICIGNRNDNNAVNAFKDVSVKLIPGNHASQSTVASKPTYRTNGVLSWLAFDGVDDYLFLSTLNLGTDKATIFMGAYRANDTTGIVYELSGNWNLNAGSFAQTNAAAPQYWTASSRGDATGSGSQVAYTSQAGADTAVITALHDISGDLSRVRRNGITGTDGTGDKGTGNFGSYPLRIGIRGDGTLPFNGRIYGIVIRSALTADPQLTQAERWMAKKTGVAL